ncbi:hypothetical protein KC356_g7545 [Hortaea werneckii]|nr:hypothetical protein KC356_g7545 [Hortaea werneckii]
MPKRPSTLFDPANIESSLLKVSERISKRTSAEFLSIHDDPALTDELSEVMHRSSLLLAMAKDGKDDASQNETLATQVLLEWTNTVNAVRQAEKTMKDLVPLLKGSNNELFEKVTSRENWYLRCDIHSFHATELESALQRRPITDAAALGAYLCKQLTETMSNPDYEGSRSVTYRLYQKFALLFFSVDEIDRRREVDIFHSLVLMLGMFEDRDLCVLHRRIDSVPGNPAQMLPHEILKTMAGKNRQGRIDLGQDPALHASAQVRDRDGPSWNFPHAWQSLTGTSERDLSDLFGSLASQRNEPNGSLYRAHPGCKRMKRGCALKFVIPAIEALREAAVDEVTAKARMLCAGRLPVELSDVVAEAALIAEGLPLESVIQESEACPTPSTMQE